jgi:hypothetical protein
MLRPCLELATNSIEFPRSIGSFHRNDHEISPVTTTRTTRRDEIVTFANQCIESTIQSTIAFDRVSAPENRLYEGYKSTCTTRLILPNLFGTLHAQFVNVMVLAAVIKPGLH